MRFLRRNTAVRIAVGPFFDKTDGVTPETALTTTNCKITFMVDDDDGTATNLIIDAAATASGGDNDMVHVTNDDAGFYDLELTAAQTNYLGRAMLAITDAANHCPVFHEFMILPAPIYDSLVAGTPQASGVALSSAAYALGIDSAGKVAVPDTQKVDLNTIKTQAITCAAGVTIRADVGFAGTPGAANGGFIAGSNAATTVASWTCTAASTNGSTVLGNTTMGTLTQTGAVSWGATTFASVTSSGTVTLNALAVTTTTTLSGAVSATSGVNITNVQTNQPGLNLSGNGTGAGLTCGGGSNGNGATFTGGVSSGNAVQLTKLGGAFSIYANGSVQFTDNLIPWNANWDADAQSEVDDALKALLTAAQWAKLAALTDGTPSGSVVDDNDPDPTATAFETDLTEASNDHYNGAFVVFYSGALAGQSRKISDYDGTTKVLTVAAAFTEAPAAGDDFLIIGRSE